MFRFCDLDVLIKFFIVLCFQGMFDGRIFIFDRNYLIKYNLEFRLILLQCKVVNDFELLC